MAHDRYLQQLDDVLHAAVREGCDPAQLLAELSARHLLSDDHDPAHVNGIAFAEVFNQAMTKEKQT
jgi:hypothetical protein